MSYDLNPRLKKFFEKSQADAPWVAFARDMARAFFDFIRSLIVVGGLKYISDKAGSIYITGLFKVSVVVLVLLAVTYIISWNVKLFRHLPWKKTGEVLDLMLNVALALVLVDFSYYLIAISIEAIGATHK